MAWYDSAVFYHIYPLGLCGCAKENTGVSESHFEQLNAWAKHAKKIGCNAIYIGPLFESEGHGYETTDYRLVDRRLGTNEDFKEFVKNCHDMGVKVVVDGVFNHTGRSFFAFQDIKKNREGSRYKDWYCNVNFWGNTEYNDGFSYENWGGYNLLAKLNQRNPEVKQYHFDTIRFWVNEFDIDGIRLDAADVLDHDFMSEMRHVTDSLKPDFWLMGEVIHGDYSRWANDGKLHSVTNYELHKALFSGHNDHNYFEIAHTIRRLNQLCRNIKLYTFADNHDVERIYSKLNNKEHIYNVALLQYTVPGIPSIYYGSEFGIEGKKERGSDWNLRPYLDLKDYENSYTENELTKLFMKLGKLKERFAELTDGEYEELLLTNRQYAFARKLGNSAVITALNNDDAPSHLEIRLPISAGKAVDLLQADEKEEEEQQKAAQAAAKEADEKALAAKKELVKAAQAQLVETEAVLAELQKTLDGLKETLGTAEDVKETQKNLEEIKKAKAALEESLADLYASCGKKEEVKKAQVDMSIYNTQVQIRDGKLIVDLPANRGTVVLVTQ
jgi:glycosidase